VRFLLLSNNRAEIGESREIKAKHGNPYKNKFRFSTKPIQSGQAASEMYQSWNEAFLQPLILLLTLKL
jgi:hypothetical protein